MQRGHLHQPAQGAAAKCRFRLSRILTSRSAAAWRDGLQEDRRLTAEQVDAAWSVLDAQCRSRDRSEEQVPTSLAALLGRIAASLVMACLGALAVSGVVHLQLPWWLWLAWWLVLLIAGLAASRVRSIGYLGIAWTVGVLGTAAYAVAVLLAWFI